MGAETERVQVTKVLDFGSSVARCEGVADDATFVIFGVESRYGWLLFDALERGEEPVVELEGWQILNRQ